MDRCFCLWVGRGFVGVVFDLCCVFIDREVFLFVDRDKILVFFCVGVGVFV